MATFSPQSGLRSFDGDQVDTTDLTATNATFVTLTTTSLETESLAIDTITGKTNPNSLSLLTSTITNTNTQYLSLLDQNVAIGSNPTFASIYVRDSGNDNTYRIRSIVDLSENRICYLPLLLADDTFVFQAFAQSLTNKTIDRSLNTLSNLSIVNADVSASAAIDATKISTGVISNTEFNFLNGLNQYLANDAPVQFASVTTDGLTLNLSPSGTVSTAEFSFINGLNQYLANDADVQFASVTTDGLTLNLSPSGTVSTAEFSFIDGLNQFLSTTSSPTFDVLSLNSISSITTPIDFDFLQYHKNVVDNYGIGNGALGGSLVGGLANIGIGTTAGGSITSGDNNICIGKNAGGSITTASDSVIIGTNALSTLATATALQCVIIGANVGAAKASSGSVQSVVIGYQDSASDFGNLSTIIGWRAGGKLNGNMVGNTIIGYNCFYANNNVDSDNNNLFGGSVLYQSTSVCTLNVLNGGATFAAIVGNNVQKNATLGWEVCSQTTGASSNNCLFGYRVLQNLTTGSVNNSILIGNDIRANAVSNAISNIIAIVPNTQTLPTTISNAIILGNSTMTKFICPITPFAAAGVVMSNGVAPYELSSTLTPSGLTSLSAATLTATTEVKTDTISERTAAAGVTIDSVLLKDGGVTITAMAALTTDLISEKTAAAGVTIDGVLCKDSGIKVLTTGGTASQLDYYEYLGHTTNWTGGEWNGDQSGNCRLERTGFRVSIFIPQTLAIGQVAQPADNISMITAIPSRFRPSTTQYFSIIVMNTGTLVFGSAIVYTTGLIDIGVGATTGSFTADGANNNGFYATTITWIIDPIA